jgi:biuret amidohydrolase
VQKPDYAPDHHRAFRLRSDTAALVLVDLQRATGSRDHGLGRLLAEQGREASGQWRFARIERVVLPTVRMLLEAFRSVGATVGFVTLGSERDDYADAPPYLRGLLAATGNRVGSPNHELLDGLDPRPDEIVVNKHTASAFLSTDLDPRLRASDVRQLVVAGVSTNTCVESTARDGSDLGYDVVIVDDGCSCASEELHRGTLDNFARLFGRVATAAEVLAEIGAARG